MLVSRFWNGQREKGRHSGHAEIVTRSQVKPGAHAGDENKTAAPIGTKSTLAWFERGMKAPDVDNFQFTRQRTDRPPVLLQSSQRSKIHAFGMLARRASDGNSWD
jgi:hypothetical protein